MVYSDKSESEDGNESGSEAVPASGMDGQATSKVTESAPTGPAKSLVHKPEETANHTPLEEPRVPPPPDAEDDPCEARHNDAPGRREAPGHPEAPSRSEAPSRPEAPSRSEAPGRAEAPGHSEAPSRSEARAESHRSISPYHNPRMHNEHFNHNAQACDAPSHDSRDGTWRQPPNHVYDSRDPPRSDLHHRDRQIHQHYPREPIHRRAPLVDRDTVRLRDTTYIRSGNPHDNPRMDNDQRFSMERERSHSAYPDRYSPIPDPVYSHERGPLYSHRHDVEGRQHLPPYDDHPAATRSGYHDRYHQLEGRRYQESQWIDHDAAFPEYLREAPPPRRYYAHDDRSRNAPDN